MHKIVNLLKRFYIIIILSLFYIPILFSTIFSFNKQGTKGAIAIDKWNGFSWSSWKKITENEFTSAILNSLILATIVSLLVISISIMTVFSLWRQKNKKLKTIVNTTSNIPLINPDIITAISISIVLSILFGSLTIENDGMWRAIVSHTTMILPYGIVLMYPRSEKFKISLFEASYDLGYGKIKTWFKTYFIFMLPVIIAVFAVSTTLSFDDFILTRTTSNVTTIGTKLYEGSFKGWALAIGGFMLTLTLIGSLIFSLVKKGTRV